VGWQQSAANGSFADEIRMKRQHSFFISRMLQSQTSGLFQTIDAELAGLLARVWHQISNQLVVVLT
jgi:hypothetical protein